VERNVPLPDRHGSDKSESIRSEQRPNDALTPSSQPESTQEIPGPVVVTNTASGWQLPWQPAWPRELASLEHHASDQVRLLADYLIGQLDGAGCRIVSFNSLFAGDGCTTMSLCAARELAERGYRILLADAHPQHPDLARLLEIHLDPHIYEIVTLIPERLELLPWSATAIEVGEGQTLSFEEVVVSMQAEFDLILLDSGSLLGSSLSHRVASWGQMHIEGVLLICNAKSPDPRRLQGVSQRLEEQGIKLLGVMENYVPS
jgi:Mrp family chromosome partitioning ATPase